MPRSDRVYLFDAAEGRAYVAEGGGQAPLGLDRIEGLLAHFRDRGESAVLRRFAAGVARGLLHAAPPAAPQLVDAAERDARGETVDLAGLKASVEGAAMAASAIGLPRGAANAAAFLAAYATCREDAHSAATEAARMGRLHAELSGGDPEAATQAHLVALLDELAEGDRWRSTETRRQREGDEGAVAAENPPSRNVSTARPPHRERSSPRENDEQR